VIDRVRLVREYAGGRIYGSRALFSVAVSDRLVPMPLRGSSTCGVDAGLLLDSSFVLLARGHP
jgi:hypothetical protein